MKNNTKIRLRLSKQLFESLSRQVIAEAKQNYGAGMEVVKAPKASKSPEVKETNKTKTVDEGMGERLFTYKDSSGREKTVTANNPEDAKDKVEKWGGDTSTVKEKSAPLPVAPKFPKKEGMEWHDMKGAEDDWKKTSKGDVDDAPSDEDKEDAKPITEFNNPEAEKAVAMLIKRLTAHWGHGDTRATIGAIKAALAKLEKKKPEGGEGEEE